MDKILDWYNLRPFNNMVFIFFAYIFSIGILLGYSGRLLFIVDVLSVIVLVFITSYVIWQIAIWFNLDPDIKKIIKKISLSYSSPLFLFFNLTDDQIKINANFTNFIGCDRHNLDWYQANEFEILEIGSKSLINLPAYKSFLQHIILHINKKRFAGVCIQISYSKLVTFSNFSNLKIFLDFLCNECGLNDLHYQVIVYNDDDFNSLDAVVLEPDNKNAVFPNFWSDFKIFCQKIIDKKNDISQSYATKLDILIKPLEDFFTSTVLARPYKCTAIHLIGFDAQHIESTSAFTPGCKTNVFKILLSKFAVCLLFLSFVFVFYEYHHLHQELAIKKNVVKNMSDVVLVKKILAQFAFRNPEYSDILNVTFDKTITNDYDISLSVFREMDDDKKLNLILSNLEPIIQIDSPKKIIEYNQKIANIYCSLNSSSEQSCIKNINTLLIHRHVEKKLTSLEDGLLPVDAYSDMDPLLKAQKIEYILDNPEIVGEGLNDVLAIVDDLLFKYPSEQLMKIREELLFFVNNFKDSASYQSLAYLLSSFLGSVEELPSFHPINECDSRIVKRLLPNSSSEVKVSSFDKYWYVLYKSYLNLNNCFPLSIGSSQDCQVSDFIGFFSVNSGVFDRIWNENFLPLIDPVAFKNGNLEFLPAYKDELGQNLINRYMQIRLIQSMFFEDGKTVIALRLRPEIQSPDCHVSLSINNQDVILSGDVHKDIFVKWDYTSDNRLDVKLQSISGENSVIFDGPWAVFKFLKEYLVILNGKAYLVFDINGQKISFAIVNSNNVLAWHNMLYDNFNIPLRVVD